MNTTVIKQSDKDALDIAREYLLSGAVIVFATDTVYGIGCMVDQALAIERIYAIKERDKLKAIPVLIGKTGQLQQIAQHVSPAADQLITTFWPGALTIIVKKNPNLPQQLTGYDTVGVRMPDHEWLRQLLIICGPLAVTSANISGQPSLSTAESVLLSLDGRIDLLVDGGQCNGGIPSTVIDCTSEPVKILRDGAISKDVLKSLS